MNGTTIGKMTPVHRPDPDDAVAGQTAAVVRLGGGVIADNLAGGPIETISTSRTMEQVEPPIAVVRDKALNALRALGGDDGDCFETILIKDRHFVGRRFRMSGFEAVWLVGERQISIFSDDSELIEVQPLDDDVVPLKKAA